MMGLTEPQIWVLIGIFGAANFGMLAWQQSSFTRANEALRETVKAGFAGVEGRFAGVDAGFAGVDAGFAGVRAGFATQRAEIVIELAKVHKRIDDLDRDVQALTRKVFGTDDE